ncbi:MAG: Holliday junction resolvase RuvX [Patescibacteria group bacterium]|nr:Holliday junction resolvase RuvX [Patescibacteria group bacterium]
MNYLGIDYGSSHIGLAKAPDGAHVAVPLRTIANDNQVVGVLREIIEEEQIHELVVGYPISLSGEVNTQAREVDAFIVNLGHETGMPVHRQDERFSSKSAPAAKNNHAQAATLILQTYLEAHPS